MKKCIMIYNSKSGRRKSKRLIPIFSKIINKYGYEFELKYTNKSGHAENIVRTLPDDIDLS